MSTSASDQHSHTPADWVNLLLGVWLVISPFVLSFNQDSALWNNIFVGAAVIVFAWLSAKRRGAVPGVLMTLAALLFLSPFVLGFWRDSFLANNVGLAFLVITSTAASE